MIVKTFASCIGNDASTARQTGFHLVFAQLQSYQAASHAALR